MGESFLSLATQLSFHNIGKLIPKESLTQKALSQDYKDGDKINNRNKLNKKISQYYRNIQNC
jgi:hypothetical protein